MVSSAATMTSENYRQEEDPSLIIPTRGDVFVEIFPEEMPEISASNLVQVLKDEAPEDLNLWNQAASMYMKSNQPKRSLTVLEEACEIRDTGDPEARAQTLAATGIALLANASGNTKNPKEQLDEADRKFTQAQKIDQFFPMMWLGKAMHSILSNGSTINQQGTIDLRQARLFLDTVFKQRGRVLPAIMVQAAVTFLEGNYKGSLDAYAEVIQRYPKESGAASRVGFALASYKLGQVDRAKAAFERALKLEPENADAMVGLAIIDLSSLDKLAPDFSQTTEKAIKMLSVANLMDPTNAMVQNHLADHYWKKWTPVAGTIDASKGSRVIKGSQSIALEAGDRVRIGTSFIATIKEDETGEEDEDATLLLDRPWNGPTEKGLKIWKKDYDRVIALARGAIESTKVKEMQAESVYFLARVYHTREQYDNAMKFYEKAYQLSPKFTPALFGIAQVKIIKKDLKAAIRDLKKVLHLSPASPDALSLLGVLEVKEARSGKLYEEGLIHLRKAIELDPLNHELLIVEAIALREHRVNFPKALKSYRTALDILEKKGMNVPADLYVNIAVLCHETKQLEESLEMYRLALKTISPETSTELLREGTGGIGEIQDPSNDMFYDFVDSHVRAVPKGGNKIALVDISSRDAIPFSEGTEVELSDSYRGKILSIDDSGGEFIVTLDSDFDLIDEENRESSSYPIVVKQGNQLLNDPEVLTIAFNIARLHETAGRTLAAIELHKAILRRNPSYLNSYLRLACIARDNSSLKECSQWLKLATKAGEGNPEVLVLVGNLHLSLADFISASKIFEMLLSKRIPQVHTYSELSMANLYLESLHSNPKRYEKTMKYCVDYFRSVLKKEPTNNYAANGLGSVLAEKGEIMKAKEVFNRVREVSGDSVPGALINLGHIYLAQKKHPEALQMYNAYLKRLEDGSAPVTSKSRSDDIVDVLVFKAFAYYDWARITELHDDANAAPADGRYREAIKVLEEAFEKANRKKETVEFNLCVVKLQAANCVLLKITRNIPRTVDEVGIALEELKESLVIAESLYEKKNKDSTKLEMRTAAIEQFLKDCRNNIKIAESHYADEVRRAKEIQLEHELQQKAAEAARREEELKVEYEKQKREERQRELDQKAEEKMKRAQELQDEWQKQQAAKQAKKEGKSSKKGQAEAPQVIEEHGLFESDDDEDSNESSKITRAKPSVSDVGASDLFNDSDEENSQEVDASSNVAGGIGSQTEMKTSGEDIFGDDSDEEVFDPKAKPEGASKGPVPTGGDLFGDSDEDSNDDSVDRKRSPEESNPGTTSKRRRLDEGN